MMVLQKRGWNANALLSRKTNALRVITDPTGTFSRANQKR